MNEIHDRESINIISVANGRSWLYDKLIKTRKREREMRVKGTSNENNFISIHSSAAQRKKIAQFLMK